MANEVRERLTAVVVDWKANGDLEHHTVQQVIELIEAALSAQERSEPHGNWSTMMAKRLPCGHNNAQHLYHDSGDFPLKPCEVVREPADLSAETCEPPKDAVHWSKYVNQKLMELRIEFAKVSKDLDDERIIHNLTMQAYQAAAEKPRKYDAAMGLANKILQRTFSVADGLEIDNSPLLLLLYQHESALSMFRRLSANAETVKFIDRCRDEFLALSAEEVEND